MKSIVAGGRATLVFITSVPTILNFTTTPPIKFFLPVAYGCFNALSVRVNCLHFPNKIRRMTSKFGARHAHALNLSTLSQNSWDFFQVFWPLLNVAFIQP